MSFNIHMKKVAERKRRSVRTRAKLFGTGECPRLSVFRSNSHIYAQLINDEKGVTLASSSDIGMAAKKKVAPKDRAILVGIDMANKAKQKNISRAVFDRGGFLYTGIIKALADAARKEGLQF